MYRDILAFSDDMLPYFVFADEKSIFETDLSGRFVRHITEFEGPVHKVKGQSRLIQSVKRTRTLCKKR